MIGFEHSRRGTVSLAAALGLFLLACPQAASALTCRSESLATRLVVPEMGAQGFPTNGILRVHFLGQWRREAAEAASGEYRLRGPDGALVPLERSFASLRLDLKPTSLLPEATYTLEQVAYFDAEGERVGEAGFQRDQAKKKGPLQAFWYPVSRFTTVEGPELNPPSGPKAVNARGTRSRIQEGVLRTSLSASLEGVTELAAFDTIEVKSSDGRLLYAAPPSAKGRVDFGDCACCAHQVALPAGPPYDLDMRVVGPSGLSSPWTPLVIPQEALRVFPPPMFGQVQNGRAELVKDGEALDGPLASAFPPRRALTPATKAVEGVTMGPSANPGEGACPGGWGLERGQQRNHPLPQWPGRSTLQGMTGSKVALMTEADGVNHHQGLGLGSDGGVVQVSEDQSRGPHSTHFLHSLPLPDGDILLITEPPRPSGGSVHSIEVRRMSLSGVLRWVSSISVSQPSQLMAAAPGSHSLLLTIHAKDVGSQAYVLSLQDGVMLTTVATTLPPGDVAKIIGTEDGFYALVFYSRLALYRSGAMESPAAQLLKLGPLGEILWAEPLPGGRLNAEDMSLAVSDSEIVLFRRSGRIHTTLSVMDLWGQPIRGPIPLDLPLGSKEAVLLPWEGGWLILVGENRSLRALYVDRGGLVGQSSRLTSMDIGGSWVVEGKGERVHLAWLEASESPAVKEAPLVCLKAPPIGAPEQLPF